MSEHISVERLSAYLDSELNEAEVDALERHVKGCASCRDDLQGLRRVVNELRSLERQQPPPVLAQQVARRVSLEGPPKGLVERLEAQLGRRSRIDSGVAVGFALVLALAAIVYLFAEAVERRQQTSVPIVVPSVTSAPASTAPPASDGEMLELGERTFRRHAGAWVEEGAGTPTATLKADESRALELQRTLPWLGELLADTGTVVLIDGDVTLEIVSTAEN